jgi:hypothetical protein
MRRRWRLWATVTIGCLGAALVVAGALSLSSGGSSKSQMRTQTRTETRAGTVARAGSGSPAPVPSVLRPSLAAPTGEVFGTNVNLLFNDLTYSPAQIAEQLIALRATGATVARSDAFWEASEPTAPVDGVHHYDWSFDDTVATALATHSLTWLPILDYSTPWAQSIAGQDHSPPSVDADYADYAQAFASRYGTGGSFWSTHPAVAVTPVTTIEIWNEPDNGEFWTPAPDAASYARLYLAARGAIDAVDPSARVIVGGLTAPTTFLPEMVRAIPALDGHVDGVAIHPYGPPAVVLAKVRAARATLTGLGLGTVPLYVTEFGWTTSPPGALDYVAAARRPTWITRTLTALGHLQCGLAATVLYTWVTPEVTPADSQDWYGIAAPGTPGTAATGATAAVVAFGAGLRAAAAPGTAPLACS